MGMDAFMRSLHPCTIAQIPAPRTVHSPKKYTHPCANYTYTDSGLTLRAATAGPPTASGRRTASNTRRHAVKPRQRSQAIRPFGGGLDTSKRVAGAYSCQHLAQSSYNVMRLSRCELIRDMFNVVGLTGEDDVLGRSSRLCNDRAATCGLEADWAGIPRNLEYADRGLRLVECEAKIHNARLGWWCARF